MYSIRPIGYLECGFVEKFGIPRQPGLAPSMQGIIVMEPEFCHERAFEGLTLATHIWVQFIFHKHLDVSPLQVRPPRLGGNQPLGVFATRSPFRTNALGLSALQFMGLIWREDRLCVKVAGIDMLQGTPIVDIKPYVPYADCLPHARFDWANTAPKTYPVKWLPQPESFCRDYSNCHKPIHKLKNQSLVGLDNLVEGHTDSQNQSFSSITQAGAMAQALDQDAGSLSSLDLKQCIVELLSQDPRPQYQSVDPNRIYGMHLFDVNIQWRYNLLPGDALEFSIEVVQLTWMTPI